MVLKSASSSETLTLKTLKAKWDWKQKIFVLVVKNFLGKQQYQGRCQTCQQYADCFQKTWMKHEHQNAGLYGSVSWESGINEWWAGEEVPSGHKRDGDQASGTLWRSQNGWLPLLVSTKVFEETEVHALNDDVTFTSHVPVLTLTNFCYSLDRNWSKM